MKQIIFVLALAAPLFCFAQIKKFTIGTVFVEDKPRLTVNISTPKTNHHLIFKNQAIQTSNAYEFKFFEIYAFSSYNLQTKNKYLGFGIQKGFKIADSGSVILYMEKEFVTGKSYTLGVAMHPQIILYRKTPRE